MTAPSHRRIAALAVPIIVANCATPLLGLVDTAVIGHLGSAIDLGAIALGSLLFNFLFWGFGFLRMGTTGFVAQARGRGDAVEEVATLLRGLGLATAIGLLLILAQRPLLSLALALFGADAGVEAVTADYFRLRIWGAPAALALYVMSGLFIGRGDSRTLLLVQLAMNGLNIVLDLLFAGVLGMGAAGIALGTALAEWSSLALAVTLGWRALGPERAAARGRLRSAIEDLGRLRQLVSVNLDIMVRTLALLTGFALFTDQGARFGSVVLAGNHLLLQLISFSAFFLDGFAFATESLVGRAFGGGDRAAFNAVVARSTRLAAATALLLATLLWLGGDFFIALLTSLEPVKAAAQTYLPHCALYVLLSFAAFQLDGIFLGTTRTRPLRNGALLALALFALAALPLSQAFGNDGLWWAFIGFVVVRAAVLALAWRRSFPAAG